MGTFTGQVTLYVLPTHHIASTAALDQQFSTRTIPSLGLTIMQSPGTPAVGPVVPSGPQRSPVVPTSGPQWSPAA